MTRSLRVLIGCATSCVALDAFLARGHDAWQCDILPADRPTNRHIQGDIRDVLADGWDLLIVSNPPCTRLCNSGVRWLTEPPKNCPREATEAEARAWPHMTRDERLALMWAHLDRGADLFRACWQAPVDRVAVENPVMNPHARARLPVDLPRPHIVQPWWFGDPAFKATGLYLRGLPELEPTDKLTPPAPGTDEHKRWSAVHRAPPGPERWKIRSKTFQGMAEAWADQWGGYAMTEVAA
jgi:hypothetical protein